MIRYDPLRLILNQPNTPTKPTNSLLKPERSIKKSVGEPCFRSMC